MTVTVVNYCVEHPAHYHLMFQRSVPGFAPSEKSHQLALGCLTVLVDRLAVAGVTAPAEIALIRGLISGLAAEQIANNPNGRQFADLAERGVRALLRIAGTSA